MAARTFKALRKVPVLIDGAIVHTVPGEQYTLDNDDVVDSLLRGEDAVEVEGKTEAKTSGGGRKNRGGAPMNKGA